MAREFELTTPIDGPPDRAWTVLMDFDSYPQWNHLVPFASGPREPGARVLLHVRGPGRRTRAFRPTIVSIDPPRTIVFRASVGHPSLIDMVHAFTIAGSAASGVVLRQRWVATGALVPVLWPMLRLAMARFGEFGDDLAARVSSMPIPSFAARPPTPTGRSSEMFSSCRASMLEVDGSSWAFPRPKWRSIRRTGSASTSRAMRGRSPVFALMRALTYAALFIGFFLVFLPSRILSGAGVTRPDAIGPWQVVGMAVAAGGLGVALWCVLVFAFVGRGTPAPFDPPRRLVVRGPYRYVRNPMVMGAAVALAGASLYYGSAALAGFTALFALALHLFVIGYEEPTLRRMFGEEYEAYARRVRRWRPRLRAGGGGSG
ncbi:MAG: methyltransferase [Gemmatimonadota bacterium]